VIKLTPQKISFLHVTLIIILGLSIYSNCSKGNFIWDDNGLIKDNDYIKDWSNLPKVITQDIGVGSRTESNFYRPLQMIVYMLGYSLWGLKTLGYHLMSILTHILAAVTLYFLLRNLFHKKTISFVASLLFVSHPINTEAVCYISGLADPLSLVFMLSCIIFYIKSLYLKNRTLTILALLSFVFALLSKESAVILPVLILLYHYTFKKQVEIKKFSLFLGILMGYILLRLAILNPLDRAPLTAVGLLERIPVFFAAIADYLRLLLLPFDLHIEYGNKIFEVTDAKVIFGLIMSFLFIIFAFIKRKNNALLFFAIAWFFITLLPASNIYPINYSFMMEHFLYAPALGFFLILSDLLCHPLKSKASAFFLRLCAFALLIFYSYLTIKQTEYWKEPITFYKRTLKYAPHSWRFYNELGIEYVNLGNNLEAEVAYKEALKINPDAAGVYYNLGNLYKKMGNTKSSSAMYKIADEINAKSVQHYYKVGSQLKAIGRYREAIAAFKKALELDQNNIIVSSDLASTYILVGRYKDAIMLFKKVLQIKPDFALVYNNLAVAYYYLKQYDLAVENCEKAMGLRYQVEPKFKELLKPYRR
jgi:tetratricopeptide (TPR) repeat protein